MDESAIATERYQVLRRIGAGGMGVVYEAEDRERGQKVALKTIADPDVAKLYQLKREFRVLADLSHPNLVALYDLVVDAEACFFTMELVDGVDLLAYLWRQTSDVDIAHAATTSTAPAMWMYQLGMPRRPRPMMPTARIGTSSTALSCTRVMRLNSGVVSPEGTFSTPRRLPTKIFRPSITTTSRPT